MLSFDVEAAFANAMKPPFVLSHLDFLYTPSYQATDLVATQSHFSAATKSIMEDIKQLREHIKLTQQQRQCLKVGRDGLDAKMTEVHAVAVKLCLQCQVLATDERVTTLRERYRFLQQLKDKTIPLKLKEGTEAIGMMKGTVKSLETQLAVLQDFKPDDFATPTQTQFFSPARDQPTAYAGEDHQFDENVALCDKGYSKNAPPDKSITQVAIDGEHTHGEAGKENCTSGNSGTVSSSGAHRLLTPTSLETRSIGMLDKYRGFPDRACHGLSRTYPNLTSSLDLSSRHSSPLHKSREDLLQHCDHPGPIIIVSSPHLPFLDHAYRAGPYRVVFGPAPWKKVGHPSVTEVLTHHRRHNDKGCPVHQNVYDDPNDAGYALIEFASHEETRKFVKSWNDYRNHDLYHGISAVCLNLAPAKDI